jgi:hypothetical protein
MYDFYKRYFHLKKESIDVTHILTVLQKHLFSFTAFKILFRSQIFYFLESGMRSGENGNVA